MSIEIADVASSLNLKFVSTLLSVCVGLAAIWINSRPKKKNEFSATPRVTLLCKVLNFLLWPTQKYELRDEFKPMDLSKITVYAMKKTGLEDFGGSFYEQSFGFVINLANNTNYSPVGYVALHDFLKRLLVTRLRIFHELKQKDTKAYCDANPVRKPIFIAGLPRTGTTFLQRLLSLDPANTSPLTWELMDPVPRIKENLEKDMKKRIKYCQKNIDMLLALNPRIADMHEIGAEIPEECTVLMGIDAPVLFFNFHTLLDCQDVFYEWDWDEMYDNYHKCLQIIKHYRERRTGSSDTRRWILKSPPHLGVLKHLVHGFPDARVVWTHRDLKECLPSFCSLIRAGQDIGEGSGIIQLDELGQHMLKYADLMFRRGDSFFSNLEQNSDFRGSHVNYKKLISDPVGTIRTLYKEFDYEFTEEYKRNIESYLAEDKKKRDSLKKDPKGTIHKYTLEEYGLTDKEVDDRFSWYQKKYIN